ncbi:MAG: T9SS type A sorting domain-containing protein [Saprospiraceae bacterium]
MPLAAPTPPLSPYLTALLLPQTQINYGCGDGAITVTASSPIGNPPFSYHWSTGSQLPVLYGMSAGSYSLSLTDQNGCSGATTFTVNYVPPLSVATQVIHVSCPEAADGAIDLQATGGLPPYQVVWNGSIFQQDLSNLSGGSYQYQLTAGGCGVTASVWVDEPEPLSLNVYFTSNSINERLSGTAIVSGGTEPYAYLWSDGTASAVHPDMIPGQTYSLTVTDASGCQLSQQVIAVLTHTSDLSPTLDFTIFPNPSNGLFTLEIPSGNISFYTCNVYSAEGQSLRHWATSATSISVDLRDLPDGVYWLCITSGEAYQCTTLVKQSTW